MLLVTHFYEEAVVGDLGDEALPGLADSERARLMLRKLVVPNLQALRPPPPLARTQPNALQRRLAATRQLLHYKRDPFCYEDNVRPKPPPYSQCCRPRKPGDAFFPCLYGFDEPEPLVACKR